MKKHLLSLLFVVFLFSFQNAHSQSYDWASNDTADYQLNPDFPMSCVTAYNGHVVHSYLETHSIIYGQAVYGTYKVKMHDQQGMTGYTFTLGPKATIYHMNATPSGDVIIMGSFMDTLDLNGADTLEVNSVGLFANNIFLIRISSSGSLIWKRNVSLQHIDLQFVDMMTLDAADNAWYSYGDFQSGKIFATDASGQDADSIIMNGRFRTVSGLSFESGNLYVSGSLESGIITLGGFSTNVTEPYNMFFTRFNSSGQVSWFHTVTDITFQHPKITADANGNAYFSGHLFDSTSIGGISIPDPQWNGGIILAKIEPTGNVVWAFGTPLQPTITGSFNPGRGNHLITLPGGGFAVGGLTKGSINWGNNIITGSSVITDNNFTVLAFDDMGNPIWKLDAPGSYVNPQEIALDPSGLTGNYYGYISSVNRDTVTFGPFSFPQPSAFTFSTSVARFGFTTTGIGDTFQKDGQLIYPNPSNGLLNFKEPLTNDLITITDVNGRIVKRICTKGQISSINTGLEAGYYIMTVEGNKKSDRFTFVISN